MLRRTVGVHLVKAAQARTTVTWVVVLALAASLVVALPPGSVRAGQAEEDAPPSDASDSNASDAAQVRPGPARSTAAPTSRVMAATPAPVSRLSGPDRFATAAVLADAWPQADDVVVATGQDFPDALAAGALCASLDAPLLLTARTTLPSATDAALARLQPKRIWVLGGTAAVSEEVAARLATHAPVERIAGPTRFETAARVAERVGSSAEVLLALGAHPEPHRAWADALSAGAYAATPSTPPLLLAVPGSLPAPTGQMMRDALAANGPVEGLHVRLIGGRAALSDGVAGAVHDLGPTSARLSGTNRYGTSASVAMHVLRRLDNAPRPLVVASGANYPDALSGAAYAARVGGVLLLTDGRGIQHEGAQHIIRSERVRFDRAVVIGGTAALSAQVVADLEHLLSAPVHTDRTSDELIDEAVAAGAIDAGTAARYRMYALHGDPRLPAAYSGLAEDGLHGFHIAKTVLADWDTYPQEVRDELKGYFVPPRYAEGASVSAAGLTFAEDECEGLYNKPPRSEHPIWAQRTTAHFTIWYLKEDVKAFVGTPHEMVWDSASDSQRASAWVAQTVEPAYTAIAGLLDRHPQSDHAKPCNGGDGSHDIYLMTMSTRLLAQVLPYGMCSDSPAFMWMNPAALPDHDTAQAILTHELTHLFHVAAYDYASGCNEYRWLEEASATWMVDHVWPDNNWEHKMAEDFLDHRWHHGLLDSQHLQSYGYADYLFLFHVARAHGPSRVAQMLDMTELFGLGHSVLGGLPGESFREVWPDFALAALNREGTDRWKHWDAMEHRLRDDQATSTVAVTLEGRDEHEQGFAHHTHVGGLQWRFVRLTFPDTRVRRVVLDEIGFMSATGDDALRHPAWRIHAWLKLADGSTRIEDWTERSQGEIELCRDVAAEDVQEVIVMYTNATIRVDGEDRGWSDYGEDAHAGFYFPSYTTWREGFPLLGKVTSSSSCPGGLRGTLTVQRTSLTERADGKGVSSESMSGTLTVRLRSTDDDPNAYEDDGSTYTVSRTTTGYYDRGTGCRDDWSSASNHTAAVDLAAFTFEDLLSVAVGMTYPQTTSYSTCGADPVEETSTVYDIWSCDQDRTNFWGLIGRWSTDRTTVNMSCTDRRVSGDGETTTTVTVTGTLRRS